MSNITLKQDPVTGETYIEIEKLLEGTNVKVEDIGYYELDTVAHNSLTITLYDKDQKLLKVIKNV